MKDFLDELDQELGGKQAQKIKAEVKIENVSNQENKAEVKVVEKKAMTHNNGHKKPVHNHANQQNKNQQHRNKPNHANKKLGFQKPFVKKGNFKAGEVRGKFISDFPETKFYLPSLREGYTRFIPIG